MLLVHSTGAASHSRAILCHCRAEKALKQKEIHPYCSIWYCGACNWPVYMLQHENDKGILELWQWR